MRNIWGTLFFVFSVAIGLGKINLLLVNSSSYKTFFLNQPDFKAARVDFPLGAPNAVGYYNA